MIRVIDYTEFPIQYMGKMAGVCYGSDTFDWKKNYNRGIDVLKSNHGRVLEFPEVVLEISGYSNRVIRELYTHIVGVTRVQESTRYINMKDRFTEYYVPRSIRNSLEAGNIYDKAMDTLADAYIELLSMGIPREDLGNLIPMGQHTKVVLKINLRALLNMFEVRTCTRAYIEFRELMSEIKKSLAELDVDWEELMADYAKTKCDKLDFCPESKSCGRYPKKAEKLGHFHMLAPKHNHTMPAGYFTHTHSILDIPKVTTGTIEAEAVVRGNISSSIDGQVEMNLREGI